MTREPIRLENILQSSIFCLFLFVCFIFQPINNFFVLYLVCFGFIHDVESMIGNFQDARWLRFRRNGDLTSAFDGRTNDLIAFMGQGFNRTEEVEYIALLVDSFAVRIEIVIDVDDIGRWENAATSSPQIDAVAPTIVGLVLDVNWIANVDVDFVGVTPGEFVQTSVSRFQFCQSR